MVEVEIARAIMAATSVAEQEVIACSLSSNFTVEEIDISWAFALVTRQVAGCSAGFKASVSIIGQKLVSEQVLAIKLFNLAKMPIAVNFTAKAIGGKILVEVKLRAVAVRMTPIQMPIAANSIHYWDQAASVCHTGICSSLKIPCS